LFIGTFDLNEEDSKKANAIVSSFFGNKCDVIDGKPPSTGRSAGSNKHYRLNVGNARYVSIKRAYDSPQNISRELLVGEVYSILEIPNYKVRKENGFPLPDWRDEVYIIMDWGPKDRRLPLFPPNEDVNKSINDNLESFISQIGRLAALNYVLAISDRKDEHFVWDLDGKILFSVDHEVPALDDRDPLGYFQQIATRRLGNSWFDDHQHRIQFTEGFTSVFKV
jgi:hypothetical protein